MERITPIRMTLPIVCLFLMLAIAGCSKINQENFDRIQLGMSYAEVVGVLGKQQTCEEVILKTKSCVWGSSEKQISIKFVGDTVVWKSAKGL